MDVWNHRDQRQSESDPGSVPFTANMAQTALQNRNFRRAVWTGNHLQWTVMCIPIRGEIGVEMHPETDQLIRVEAGQAAVHMGTCRGKLHFRQILNAGDGVLVPCGTWHNVVNVGNRPLKLSSLYAPVQHPRGTVHRTKAEAEKAE